MGVCVLLVLHIATLDTQPPNLIGPPVAEHGVLPTGSDPWKIEGLGGMSPTIDLRLAFQTLAPAGGSQLGKTGYMSRNQNPTFGGGSNYSVRRQQRSRYRQAQRGFGSRGIGGFGGYGYGGYGGYGRYGGYGWRGRPVSNRSW